MKLHILKNGRQLSEELAEWICNEIETVLKDQESFSLMLSGGETPKALFKTFAAEPYRSRIPWQKLQIFWGDERVVPFNDPRNNAGVACKLFIDPLGIPSSRVHTIRTDIEPNFAVDAYRQTLHRFFDNTHHSFDLALLGLGSDGHTLSIFPQSPLIKKTRYWVNAAYLAEQSLYRITLMPVLVNKSAKIAFMVSGKDKADILQKVLESPYDPETYPAQLIKPKQGELHWFTDKDAASGLSERHG